MNAKKQLIFISFIPMCMLTACHTGMKGLQGSKNVHLGLPALAETKANLNKVELEDIPERLDNDEVIHGAGMNQGRYTLINMDSTDMSAYTGMKVEWDSINKAEMMNLTLDNVQILGHKIRNIAERDGMVCVDFVLSVPRSLTHDKRLLSIYPVMMRGGEKDSLQEVRFTGENFRRKQQRGYDKYNRYVDRIIPDSADFYSNFVDGDGFTDYMKGLERERASLSNEWNELEVKKGKKGLLDRRFEMFNAKQEKSYAVLTGKRNVTAEADSRSRLIEDRKFQLPHYWLRRDTAYTFNRISRKQDKVERELEGIVIPDSAVAVQDFLLDRKIARNEKLKNDRERVYNDLVRFPYNENARLDSVVQTNDSIYYFYTNKVKADENSSKIYITAETRAVNYANDSYLLPPTDTLVFIVSSMTDFIADRTRYVEKIVKRDLEVNFSSYINFPVGKWGVNEELGQNREELQKVMSVSHNILTDTTVVLDGIVQTGFCSPEGSLALNTSLAEKRGRSVNEYLKTKLMAMGDTMTVMDSYIYDESTGLQTVVKGENPIPDILERMEIMTKGEDWDGLKRMIVEDNSGKIGHKAEIVSLIEKVSNLDRREMMIAARYPADYRYIRDMYYEKLRRVDFSFKFRRKGMLEESVVTNVPDTVYANGVELLRKREYEKALEVLRKYNDENTALAYLSLGYDNAAERVLDSMKEKTPMVMYMNAIAKARLGKDREAAKLLLKAGEMEPKLRFRANLDPELSELVKRYNIFGDNF